MKKKEYKCKSCGDITSILTLGDIYKGCANCGSLEGFKEKVNGKWVEKGNHKTPDLDKLNNFLS